MPTLELPRSSVRTAPVLLVRGAAGSDRVAVAVGDGPGAAAPVVGGRFVLPVRLRPGRQRVRVRDAGGAAAAVVTLQPADVAPYHSLVVAAADERARYPDPDGPGDDLASRFGAALELLQAVMGDLLEAAGLPWRTFALERAADGRPQVRTLRLIETGADLRAADPLTYWRTVRAAAHAAGLGDPAGDAARRRRRGDRSGGKVVALMGWTRYDAATGIVRGHCARGGADLALFGGGSVHTWPASLADVPRAFTDATPLDGRGYDDSAHRGTRWASAATTIGAVLHEIGHTLGLGHCKQPGCVMLRGFDHLGRLLVTIEPASRRRATAEPTASLPRPRWCEICAATLRDHPFLGA